MEKIYCSGIGGIGLSAYASLRNAEGQHVLGSDRSNSDLLDNLRTDGIEIFLNQDGSTLPEDTTLFVYSEAIDSDHPERQKAEELGIRSLSYPAALGELSASKKVIAVCGTHGKSSTTAMAAKVLVDAGLDPTVVVGTKVPDIDGKNWRAGGSDLFLLEACEYRGSFHNISPDIILMTNVDGDHFDVFSSVEEYQQAFVDFLKKLPEDGVVITHLGDKDCARVVKESGKTALDAGRADAFVGNPHIAGRHMSMNSALVTSLSEYLGLDTGDLGEVMRSLGNFTGTWRRLEEKGTNVDGITVVDDYAHHPKEVIPTIAAAREKYKDRRLVCVFQPHMHDRTIQFFDEFTHAFKGADLVIITDVYEARTEPPEIADLPKLAEEINADIQGECILGGSLSSTENLLKQKLQKDDVLLIMGAGDVTDLASRMVASSLAQ